MLLVEICVKNRVCRRPVQVDMLRAHRHDAGNRRSAKRR
jgi:hypothetical protein